MAAEWTTLRRVRDYMYMLLLRQYSPQIIKSFTLVLSVDHPSIGTEQGSRRSNSPQSERLIVQQYSPRIISQVERGLAEDWTALQTVASVLFPALKKDKIEEKAKVVDDVLGTEVIQSIATLAILF